MFLQLIQILVIRQIFFEMLVITECIQISKDCIAFQRTRIFDTDMVRVCEHAHDLLLDILRIFRKINTVAQRLAHLPALGIPQQAVEQHGVKGRLAGVL